MTYNYKNSCPYPKVTISYKSTSQSIKVKKTWISKTFSRCKRGEDRFVTKINPKMLKRCFYIII